MYECPNCGGNLKFDIPTQLLKCDYCKTAIDPYSVQKDHDAIEETMYDVTIFTCPQCGGEILSTDNTAAGFCSFCGASTILSSRISHEKRPDYIIPFQKTKEDCKQAYSQLMKHALFAPKDLKDSQCIDNFRGIYMPYWAYMITQNGPFALNGEKEHRKGNYIYTDHYLLEGDINAYYKGINYDASSSFSDNISETIAPFDVRGMKAFTPSYLSGFYADTADVDSLVYQVDAETFANEHSMDTLIKTPAFQGYQIKTVDHPDQVNQLLKTQCSKTDNAMFPVWFLSYRKGDRVAYATVNGQTGKVAADLPVAIWKYLFGSLLLAIPIFFLLNLVATFRPITGLAVSSVLALITAVIYITEIKAISQKEKLEDDRGMLFHEGKPIPAGKGKLNMPNSKKNSFTARFIFIFLFIWVTAFISPILGSIGNGSFTSLPVLLIITSMIGGIITCIIGGITYAGLERKSSFPGFVSSLLTTLIAAVIAIFQPTSDLWYYGGTILSMIAVFVTLIGIIQAYNILSTRKLPQFNRTGGDDRA